MNNNYKKYITLSIIAVTLIIIIAITMSYAFFLADIYNAETGSTIKANSNFNISLELNSNNNNISATNIGPGWSETKNFSVINSNDLNSIVPYDISLNVVNSNFYTNSDDSGTSYLTYEIKKCTSSTYNSCTTIKEPTIISVNNLSDNKVLKMCEGTIPANSNNNEDFYKMILMYPYLENQSQSQTGVNNGDLIFEGKISVSLEHNITKAN